MRTPLSNSDNTGTARVLRRLTICGLLLIFVYIGYFAMMQSKVFYSLRLTGPVQGLFPDFFEQVRTLLPTKWLELKALDKFAVTAVWVYLAFVALAVGTFLYAVRQVSKPDLWKAQYVKPALRTIFAVTAVVLVVLLFLRGLFTTDIYAYVWYARVWVEHGASPLVHVPAEFAQFDEEGSLGFVFWKDWPSAYGPVWILFSSAFYKLGQLIGGLFAQQVLLFRVLVDLAHLLNAWLIWNVAGLLVQRWEQPATGSSEATRRTWRSGTNRSRRLAVRAQRLRASKFALPADEGKGLSFRFGALIFYAWNPLLLVEFGGNSHNDALMLTFVLLGLWLHLKGMWRVAALAFGLATLVKLAALPFLLVYLWLLLWEGYRAARRGDMLRRYARGAWRAAQAGLIIAAAWVLLYIPFWEGPQTLKMLTSSPFSIYFLNTFAENIVRHVPSFVSNIAPFFGVQDAGPQFTGQARLSIEQVLKMWLLPLAGVMALFLTWRARTLEQAVTTWGWVIFAAILGQTWFMPWYASWMVVPAALSTSTRLRNATLIFSVTALLHYLNEYVLFFRAGIFYDLSGFFIMGPPLTYLFGSWLHEAARKRKTSGLLAGHSTREQPAAAS